ncbi:MULTISPECIES: MFS transporter [Streptococcus]|uniref:Phosphoglycerate transporter protein n=1 Tax=Streptococcus acidominimus TaxID=1326 RepID=A0A239WL28_STRAI|nr:MFS transporter [Streptococcus acidominimus]SNV35132.1 phosphoglycerate transporter protein [Streptococcus acidominimus]
MKQKIERVGHNYWMRLVFIFFLGWILMYATRTIFNPIMGNVGDEFGLTNADLGLANSIFFLTYAVAQIPFGILGDKFGRKLVITVGFIGLAVTTFLSGLAQTFSLFLWIRALAGIAQGAYYGPQYAMSSEAIPKDKVTLGNALINSGMAFGTSGGFLLSSSIVLAGGGHWSQPFYIMAVPTAIVAILFYTLLKEKVTYTDIPEVQEKTEEVTQKVSLKDIFTNKNLVAVFIVCFVSIYANFVILTWLPSFLIQERGFAGGSVGFIASLVPWASIPGALFFASIKDRIGSTKKMMAFLMPFALLSVFLIANVTDKTFLIVVLILYGLTGKLALDPILISYVNTHAPKGSLSTTLSAYNFIGMSGSILAPYVTGYLADKVGSMQIGFYLAAILLGVGLLVFMLLAVDTKKSN